MPVAALTLDAAGTLFEVAAPVGATYAAIAARHGIAADASAVGRAFRAALATAPPLAFPGAGAAEIGAREEGWWYAVVRHAFGPAAAAPGFDAAFVDLYAHYGRPTAWRVFAEVPGALAALRARGLRLAVVSNFDARLDGLLAGLGLAPLVDATVASTRAGAAKPDPAIFTAALDRLGVSPAAAVHVGDSVEADVAGARAAGLGAVLVDRAGRRPPRPPGVPAVRHLGELPALLDAFPSPRRQA